MFWAYSLVGRASHSHCGDPSSNLGRSIYCNSGYRVLFENAMGAVFLDTVLSDECKNGALVELFNI